LISSDLAKRYARAFFDIAEPKRTANPALFTAESVDGVEGAV